MQIKSIFLPIVLCVFISSCSTQRAVNAPLIFHLESENGMRSCLMATSHVAVTPSPESEQLINCIKYAKAYAFEVNIALTPKNILQIFERNPGEIGFSDLSFAVKEKIRPALLAAKYNNLESEYILKLHPVGIYRALTYSKILSPEVKLVPNSDILLAQSVLAKKAKYIELEGFSEWAMSEKQISLEQLNELILIMCDLILNPIKLEIYKTKITKFAEALNILPDIESGWNLKFFHDTKILGLPAYSTAHEVDNRNALIGTNMLKAIKENDQVMMFVGAAHVGGPQSVLKILEKGGVKVERVQ
jgi:hypothetical protein